MEFLKDAMGRKSVQVSTMMIEENKLAV